MGLFIAFLGIACTALLCSKRFHDFLIDKVELHQARAERKTSGNIQLKRPTQVKRMRFKLQAAAVGVLLCSLWLGVRYVHNNIIPIPMAAQILTAFDSDTEAWERNIEKGELGDLGEAHEEWSQSQGLGYDHSRHWQEELWANWRLYANAAMLICFLGLFAVAAFIYFVHKKFDPETLSSAQESDSLDKPQPSPSPRKKRVTKIRRTKVRVLNQETIHKALTGADISRRS